MTSMNHRSHRLRTALIAMAAAAPMLAAPLLAAPSATGVPVVQALWNMNEPANATVMVDSSGNGLNGAINQAGLNTGVSFGGAVGYEWAARSPTAPPPEPARVIQVPDNSRLDPGTETFTVEIRFRTTKKYGNIIQKGQSASVGGQWKIQNPGGLPSCLFKSSTGSAGVQAKVAINNNAWHVLQCIRTPTKVTMYMDGVYVNQKNGNTGNINNTIPMTIGGKINCNQTTITCDYFTGMIDYVKITKGT